jgi:hypothetical protein
LSDQTVAPGAVDAAATRQQVKARQQNVVADRKIHDQTEPTLAGHKADAESDGGRRACDPMQHAIVAHVDRPATDAEYPPQHATSAAANEAGEAYHFVRTQTNGVRAIDRVFEQHGAGRQRFYIGRHHRAAGHGLDQIGDFEGAAPAYSRSPPIAQHGAAVADRDHLVETVRNVDDRRALAPHAREHGEQSLYLARLKRGGRFIENQDTTAPVQHLSDGNKLTLGKTQAVDPNVGIGRKIELGKLLLGLFAHARAIDHPQTQYASQRLIAERDVLGNRERRDKPQFLRNRYNPCRNGVPRAIEPANPPVDCDLAPVWPMYPAENSHQRRFPGSVLAHERVQLAGQHIEIHVSKRSRRAEMF